MAALTLPRRFREASASLFERYRPLRFTIVGAFNTAFSYGLYALLLLAGLKVAWASLLALVLGIAFSFATQGTVVFRNATRFTFARFVVAWAGFYFFNLGLITALVRGGLDAYWAGAAATVPTTVLSYFVQKHFVFRPRRPSNVA